MGTGVISRTDDSISSNILRCEIRCYRKKEPIEGFFVVLNPVLTVTRLPNVSQTPAIERLVPGHTVQDSMPLILNPLFGHPTCRHEYQ